MPDDRDHYGVYYADKLWNLLPEIYRTLDSNTFGRKGPLRELVDRVGAQAAILRRSIDRLWEDQSIETCDDWVIPYIGDLLATNLVASLDGRGQRLDVAKTIYYRRRKGTLAILEEIASDITGWDARALEFFRRMGRTRHSLDPKIGIPADTTDPAGARDFRLAEGLMGRFTRTPMGGWADLRNVYGAGKTDSAFDEFYHTADFRLGRGRTGWYNIPKVGVFLWRLKSFGVSQTTPVAVDGGGGTCFSFDPTGRRIPLFAEASRTKTDNFGDNWVSPEEQQLPTPIGKALLDAEMAALYPRSVGVFVPATGGFDLVDPRQVKIIPEIGFVKVPAGGPVFVTYHYGFSSTIGAGPYNRFQQGTPPAPQPLPATTIKNGSPLTTLSPVGTTTIGDSLTYDDPAPVMAIQQVTLLAAQSERPLVRLPLGSAGWVFTGAGEQSSLVLEGMFVSGGDVVLRGVFDNVTLTCCTLDPGTIDPTQKPAVIATSVDGRQLTPTHLQVEGTVRSLVLDRCIAGPVRTRGNGVIEHLSVRDSIVQALPIPAAESALEMHQGLIELSRTTILGQVEAHQFDASECILDEVAIVDDPQHGCVRFTAWSSGSTIPRQYESVEVSARSALFTSREFGAPGYAQLLTTADSAILSPPGTIVAGAQDGSEMGAFPREKNSIKDRSLLIKFNEFMPLGIVPVIIHVT
jgi:hypothetical protein